MEARLCALLSTFVLLVGVLLSISALVEEKPTTLLHADDSLATWSQRPILMFAALGSRGTGEVEWYFLAGLALVFPVAISGLTSTSSQVLETTLVVVAIVVGTRLFQKTQYAPGPVVSVGVIIAVAIPYTMSGHINGSNGYPLGSVVALVMALSVTGVSQAALHPARVSTINAVYEVVLRLSVGLIVTDVAASVSGLLLPPHSSWSMATVVMILTTLLVLAIPLQ